VDLTERLRSWTYRRQRLGRLGGGPLETLCDIIAAFGDPEAIPRLTPLINDPSQTVADKANRAVERLRRSGGAKASR